MSTTTTATVAAGNFVEETVFYFFLKVATSMDDLIWLSPFVALAATPSEKTKTFAIYACVCLLVSLEALGLAWIAVHGLTLLLNQDAEIASKVLNVVGGLCIAVFACREWRGEDADEEEEDDDDDASSSAALEDEIAKLGSDDCAVGYGSLAETASLLEKGETPRDDTLATEEASGESTPVRDGVGGSIAPQHHEKVTESARHRRHVLIDLFLVGIFGTLDTLAVFFSVLMSRSPMRVVPLLIGSMLAAVLIMVFAYSITLCMPLTRCLQRVPLWALLAAIALYILVSGLAN